MTNIDSEIIRKALEHNYKNEVIAMSETLNDEVKELGYGEKLYLDSQIDGDVLGKDDQEIIDIMAKRLINYKIREKAFEKLLMEKVIRPVNLCEDSCFITKNFQKYDGTSTAGRFGFRRIIYDEFVPFGDEEEEVNEEENPDENLNEEQ